MAVNSFGNIDYTVPGGGMTLLSTTNLSGVATTISSINQTYTDLVIIVQNPYVNTATQMRLLMNSGGSNNSMAQVYGSGAGVNSNLMTANNIPTATGNASYYCRISNYANSTYTKPAVFYGSATSTASTAVSSGGMCLETSAITTFDVATLNGTSTFSGGRVLVYGVK